MSRVLISEQLDRQLLNLMEGLVRRSVEECGRHYGFNADEACELLGLTVMKIERKSSQKEKGVKKVKVSTPKPAFPLPFNGEFNESCCYALRQNNGLYTQCTGLRKGEAHFCKSCATTMQKTGAEVPEYGTIQQRLAVGLFEFVDPKGRKPTVYSKIMKKYKITAEQVLEEAGKFNITINPIHFEIPVEEAKRGRPKTEKEPKIKGVKGRPKKEKKVLLIEGDDEDLFAALVAEANESADESQPKKKVAGKSDEEKEAKKLAAEQAKKEKEAKLAAEKAAKEAAKSQKSPSKSKKEPEVEEEPDVVKKIEFEGVKYLKSKKTGIVYDYDKYVQESEQVVIGKWNEEDKKIDFNQPKEEDEEEEEEEEYDL